MSVKIIIDSTTDLMPAVKARCIVVPLTVHFGDEEYIDGVTISHQEFYEKLVETDEMPRTSQAPPAAFAKVYEKLGPDDSAVVITLTADLSGTYQSAMIAATDYENIHVVDGRSVAIGSGILAELALQMVDAGMDAMSDAVHPLRELPEFRTAMAQVSNPLAGLAVGTIVTAVIQSSSASIGILQAIAGEGLISLNGALYILFGQNIGTCITAMLACAGVSRDAKRAALLHLLFNMIGAGLMTAAALLFPLDAWISALAPDSPRLQIALAHVLFNLATTAVLLPASGLLVRMACSLARQQQ